MEAGSSDTLLHDELALTVKMSDKLALSVGYAITDNTKPPAPLKKLDTVATRESGVRLLIYYAV